MSATALQSMRFKRLDDAMQGRGYGTPANIQTPANRSVQLLGSELSFFGEPSGTSSMLSVYEKGGRTFIQRGWLEGTEITGTGQIDLAAGDRVYVRAEVLRQSVIWYTTQGDDPVTLRYFTGAYSIKDASILIVSASAASPSDSFSEPAGERAVIHQHIYTVPANGVLPVDGSAGRWLRLSQGELLF